MTTGKAIPLTRWTFVGKVMSLLFNMLSRLVITFLPRSKRVLISWLQSPSAVILERKKIWMIISRSIHVAVNGIISFFLWQSDIPLFVYIYNIFLIHSCQWTLRLCPCLGYYKSCCCEHYCIYVFELEFSSFLNICPGVGLLGLMATLFLAF